MGTSIAEQAAPEVEDGDLVLRHRYGDPAAFEEIYARYEGMVFNLALRLAGDRQEAEDASQEAFVRVYRHLHRFKGRSTLRTWIYRVALNCCRSRLQRRSRAAALASDQPPGGMESVPDPRRGPEARALAHDLGDRVAEALARLPAEFREAVVLRDLEGLSYQEIAAVSGRRIGTVRSRIARGRERLRGLLREEEA